MNKVLPYAATAILLGMVTMVAPLMLLKPAYYEAITARDGKNAPPGYPASLDALDGGEGTFGEGGALERAVSPPNLSSAGLILAPSFLLALGVYVYVKKRVP